MTSGTEFSTRMRWVWVGNNEDGRNYFGVVCSFVRRTANESHSVVSCLDYDDTIESARIMSFCT